MSDSKMRLWIHGQPSDKNDTQRRLVWQHLERQATVNEAARRPAAASAAGEGRQDSQGSSGSGPVIHDALVEHGGHLGWDTDGRRKGRDGHAVGWTDLRTAQGMACTEGRTETFDRPVGEIGASRYCCWPSHSCDGAAGRPARPAVKGARKVVADALNVVALEPHRGSGSIFDKASALRERESRKISRPGLLASANSSCTTSPNICLLSFVWRVELWANQGCYLLCSDEFRSTRLPLAYRGEVQEA